MLEQKMDRRIVAFPVFTIRATAFPNEHPDYIQYLKENDFPPFSLSQEVYGKFPNGEDSSILSARQDQPADASIPAYLADRTMKAMESSIDDNSPFFARIDFGGLMLHILPLNHIIQWFNGIEFPEWNNSSESFEGKPAIQKDYLSYWGVQDFQWNQWQHLIQQCLGYTALIDAQVGKLVSFLKAKGIYEDTVIIYSSDHGGMVGSHKLFDKGPYQYDEILRVPMLVRIPGLTDNWFCKR